MNVSIISGRLAQNAIVFGKEQETLKFTVACRSGFDSSNNKPRVGFVPCVFFRAPEKLRELLMKEGKGKPVELRGRIMTSSYDKAGETRYATEVVVDPREFHLVRYGANAHPAEQPAMQRNHADHTKGEPSYASGYNHQQTPQRHFPGFGDVGY